jgi:hypothetical protein
VQLCNWGRKYRYLQIKNIINPLRRPHGMQTRIETCGNYFCSIFFFLQELIAGNIPALGFVPRNSSYPPPPINTVTTAAPRPLSNRRLHIYYFPEKQKSNYEYEYEYE